MRCKNCFLRNNIANVSVFIAIRSRCFVSSEYAEFPTTTTEKQHKQLWSDLFSYVQDFNVCRRFIINRFVIYLCIYRFTSCTCIICWNNKIYCDYPFQALFTKETNLKKNSKVIFIYREYILFDSISVSKRYCQI